MILEILVGTFCAVGIIRALKRGPKAKPEPPVSPMLAAVREKRRVLERSREEWMASHSNVARRAWASQKERDAVNISHTTHLEDLDKKLLALADEEACIRLMDEEPEEET